MAKFTGQIDCDCGTIYLLNGRLNEDQFLDLMDAMDDTESINIKAVKKNGKRRNRKGSQ